MPHTAILYVPSDTPEAMSLATKRVAGVPLIVRGIMTLADAGMTTCVLLIAASQRERIVQFLMRYREERLPEVHLIAYDEPYRVSPATIEAVAARFDRRALVIDANLLFDCRLLGVMREGEENDDAILIAFEGAHPLPVLSITKESWLAQAQFALESPRAIESCLKNLIVTHPHAEVQKPAQVSTFLLRRRHDIPVAEKFLAECIRHGANGWVARQINKRLSLPVSMFLTKTWVSPHAITCVNIVTGLLSGVFLAGNNYYSMLIGATLYQLASVADGVDGEIAKLTFRASKFGQYMDTVSDNLALVSLLIGLTIGSYRTLRSSNVFIAGGIAVVGIAVIIAMMVSYLKRHTNSASLVTFDREFLQKSENSDHPFVFGFLKYFKHFAKKDLFSFIVFVLALVGLLPYWMYFVALGAVLGSIALVYLNVCGAMNAGTVSTVHGESMKKKMVVFDFDGTLVNSMEQFADIASRVMAKYYPITVPEARAQYLQTSGLPFFQQLETIFPGNSNNAHAAEEYERIKKQSYFSRPVFTDAAATISELRTSGVKVAVSSNNFQELVDDYIARTGIEFDMVMGYRDNFAKGEDHFQHIETTCGITRDEMTFVGDSLKDGEKAAASGVTFIAKEGIFDRKEFGKHFPEAQVISALSELKKFI